MCGHVGIAGKLVLADESTLKRMLLFDYFRGPDSTGLAAVSVDKSVTTVKIASHPIDLFDTKKFNDALNGYRCSTFIGHNRFATKGAVNGVNAHPYTFDHITGAHNGTLDKSSWDALERELGENFAVDSMAIIAGIARLGLEKTLSLMQGAWALVWYDQKEDTLNFLRNKERPFWFAYSEDFDKVFWASEHQTIAAAIGMSSIINYKMHKTPDGFTYFASKEDWHYRFSIAKLRAGSQDKPKPTVKKIVGKEPAPVKSAGGHTPFHTTRHGIGVQSGSTTTTSFPDKMVTLGNPVLLNFQGCKIKPLGDFVTEEQFHNLSQGVCSYCTADVEFGEQGVRVFKERGYVLCRECSGGSPVSRIYLGPDEAHKLMSQPIPEAVVI